MARNNKNHRNNNNDDIPDFLYPANETKKGEEQEISFVQPEKKRESFSDSILLTLQNSEEYLNASFAKPPVSSSSATSNTTSSKTIPAREFTRPFLRNRREPEETSSQSQSHRFNNSYTSQQQPQTILALPPQELPQPQEQFPFRFSQENGPLYTNTENHGSNTNTSTTNNSLLSGSNQFDFSQFTRETTRNYDGRQLLKKYSFQEFRELEEPDDGFELPP
jgi:hypothetical protein